MLIIAWYQLSNLAISLFTLGRFSTFISQIILDTFYMKIQINKPLSLEMIFMMIFLWQKEDLVILKGKSK